MHTNVYAVYACGCPCQVLESNKIMCLQIYPSGAKLR